MPRGSILVVDDELEIREGLEALLTSESFDVTVAETGVAGLQKLEDKPFDLMLLDVSLPDRNGLDMLREIRLRDPNLAIILITAYGSIDMAREAFKGGAQDYITKPWSNDELIAQISLAIEGRRLREENLHLKRALKQRYNFPNIVGKSEKMLSVLDLVTQVAPSRSTVLISGESGTGKEVIAKAIHSASTRADKAFIPINTGSIPVDLLESQLFGHVKGAFTSAVASKKGLFEVADQGTIFFDEISTISPETQAKLLRVIQEREFMRLGGTETIKVDVRILAASNEDLRKLVREGRFREDLFHRLNVISIHLPPLRERKEDIPLARGSFPGTVLPRQWQTAARIHDRRDEAVDGLRLAGKYSRAGKRGGARRGALKPGIHGRRAVAGKRADARDRQRRPVAACGISAAAPGGDRHRTVRCLRRRCLKFSRKWSAASSWTCLNAQTGTRPKRPSAFRFRSRRSTRRSSALASRRAAVQARRGAVPAFLTAKTPRNLLPESNPFLRVNPLQKFPAFTSPGNINRQLCEPLGNQRSTGDIFEDSIWGKIGRNKRFRRNEKRLFERVLAGHRRVRDAVGEDQPRRKRRKFEPRLRAVLLKLGIFLQVIVKAEHEHVVGRAAHPAETELLAPILHGAANPGIFGDPLAVPRPWRIALRGLRSYPWYSRPAAWLDSDS